MRNYSKLTKRLDEIIEQFKEKEFGDNINNELKEKRNFPGDFLDIAINHARQDMMVRTLKVKKGGAEFNVEIRNIVAERFKKYFIDSDHGTYSEPADFEKWHKETCDATLAVISEHYEDPQYGKAQKVVNMTFKYLYCFANEKQRQSYFKFCHMPIDSVILKWVKIEAHIPNGKIPCWSNLQYSDSSKEAEGEYTYKKLVSVINKLLPKDSEGKNEITPLQAEFFIWPTMQLSLAADKFSKQLKKYGNNETVLENQIMQVTSKSLREDLKNIQSILRGFEIE